MIAHRPIFGDKQNEDDSEQRDRDFGDQIRGPLAPQGPVKHEPQRAESQHRFGQDHRERKRRLVHGSLVLENGGARSTHHRPTVLVAATA